MNKLSPKLNRNIFLDTNSQETAIIPVDELPNGKWTALFTWEYDGKEYVYEKDFEIKDRL